MSNTKIDPITLDIVRDSLLAISEEVFYAFARTSMSPIIYESLDYASGITDPDGNLLTQGNGCTGFIGVISPLVRTLLDKFGKENMHPGDVFIINDPYVGGGTHISDIGMGMPVFYQDELIAFVGNKAHWSDVGGMAAGSFTTDATEVYQEGLCFPGVKLLDRGNINEALVDMLKANVRWPDTAEGDMWGQIASLRTGYRRLNEICDKYGVHVVRESMARLLDQGEKVARARLKELPKGTWEMSDFMDDDGNGNMVEVKVKVTISDDGVFADYTGTAAQLPTPMNSGFASLAAGPKAIMMAVINPSMAANDGVFRILDLYAEEGSVINAQRPAPTSCFFESFIYATDVVWHAMAELFPEYVGAGHALSVCSVLMNGPIPGRENERFIIVEPTAGGWGASPSKDGVVGQFCISNGETYNVPVEMAESRYGIMVDEYSLHTDGAGAGEFRGGSGCVRTYRAMSDGQQFTAAFGRHKIPTWGAGGGKNGSTNYFEFHLSDGTVLGPMGSTARQKLDIGDCVRLVTCTGGGYGNPFKRDPEKVSWDAKNEYITVEQAKEDYGVLLDPKTFAVLGFTDARQAQ